MQIQSAKENTERFFADCTNGNNCNGKYFIRCPQCEMENCDFKSQDIRCSFEILITVINSTHPQRDIEQ